MSKFSDHLAVLANLARVAQRLADDEIPTCDWDDDDREDNNWTATKAEMELCLGRSLNDEEVTLLSLSRAFGPTPSFNNGVDPTSRLWPNGNPRGLRYDWDQLVEELITFRDGNDNSVFVHASGLRGVYIVTLRENPDCGYLAEEDGDNAWFEMPCIGWFGPGGGWDDPEKAIRSLTGYPVDASLMADIAKYQLLWDQGRTVEAGEIQDKWHPDAFAAQLWQGVTLDDALDRAIAALIKLRTVAIDGSNEQQAATTALTTIMVGFAETF